MLTKLLRVSLSIAWPLATVMLLAFSGCNQSANTGTPNRSASTAPRLRLTGNRSADPLGDAYGTPESSAGTLPGNGVAGGSLGAGGAGSEGAAMSAHGGNR